MHARAIARGPVLFIALALSAALAQGFPPPALATVLGGATLPAAPTLCDSVRLLIEGVLPSSCYWIREFRVGAPVPLPTMGPVPTYLIEARIRVEAPSPIAEVVCPTVLEPYRLAEKLGTLPFGRYWVRAREYVFASSPADTTTPIDSSRAFIDFSVGTDSCRASNGCALLGFAPPNSPNIEGVQPDGCTTRALPGGRACFDVTLRNEAPVAAFQTVVELPPGEAFPYDFPNLIVPIEVVPAERAAGFAVAWNREVTTLKIVAYSTTGAVIPPGSGPVLHLCYDVKAGTPEGSYEITFGPSLLSTPLGEVIPFCPTFQEIRGRLCVGEGGCDLNGDGVGDVRDIARLVRCVLGDSTDVCPDSIRAKADCNDDALVDVRDVVCCVQKILTHDAGWGPIYPVASTFSSDESSIGFEGPVESGDAFEAHATVSIVRGAAFGGVQFVLNPGTAARVRAISLDDPLGVSTLRWEPRPDGSARVMVYDAGGPVAASQPSPGSASGGAGTARLRVTLERSSNGDGELSLDPVRSATATGTILAIGFGTLRVALPAGAAMNAPAILPARPNPFVSETEISFSLASAGPASLRLFDVTGRLVRTLHEGWANAGPQRLRWDGRDDRGRTVGVGIYFVRLTAGGIIRTERILRLR